MHESCLFCSGFITLFYSIYHILLIYIILKQSILYIIKGTRLYFMYLIYIYICWYMFVVNLLFSGMWVMVFNAIFNNISVISWWSVLSVEET